MGLERHWEPRHEHGHEHEENCPECSNRVVWVEIPAKFLGPEYLDFALVRDGRSLGKP